MEAGDSLREQLKDDDCSKNVSKGTNSHKVQFPNWHQRVTQSCHESVSHSFMLIIKI